MVKRSLEPARASSETGTEHRNDMLSQQRILVFVLLALSIGMVMDLIFDQPATLWSFHVLFEVSLALFGLCAVVFFWLRLRQAGQDLVLTQEQMSIRSAERDQWRGRTLKLLAGLGSEMDRHLREWGLSPAERETALMLLKGLEHKQIAAVQGKSERTVRQHAIAVYRKSGLSGRAELSAFFLEDLLLPAQLDGKPSEN